MAPTGTKGAFYIYITSKNFILPLCFFPIDRRRPRPTPPPSRAVVVAAPILVAALIPVAAPIVVAALVSVAAPGPSPSRRPRVAAPGRRLAVAVAPL